MSLKSLSMTQVNMNHVTKLTAFFVVLTTVITLGNGDTLTKIIYKVAARNLPADKNAFAEIQKDRPFYCRTESLRSLNPDWTEICEVEFRSGENDTRLAIEVRNNIASAPDESIGFAVFMVRDMLENGKVLTEEIRHDADPRGTLKLTVLLACVPGEPGCGLPQGPVEKNQEPLLNLKIFP